MLYKYNIKNKKLLPMPEVNFASFNILERQDIEAWINDQPDMVGEELLIITTEYDKFDKTKERLDILALDKNGKVVVLELKRDDSGKNVELQAIKYAAYCSTLTFNDVVELRKNYLDKKGKSVSLDQVQKEIDDFIENEEFEEIDEKPRIILISKEFRPEVTASVLWLRNYQIDISCIKLIPHRISEDEIGIVAQKIIPLPEAEDYQIKIEEKESGEKSLTRTQQEYIKLWSELKTQIESRLNITTSKPSSYSYFQIPTGIGSIHFEWYFQGRPRSRFGVELHFEKGNREENSWFVNSLRDSLPELEETLGEKIQIMENWGKKWSRIYIQRDEGQITEDIKKYALEKMEIMYNYLKPKLDKLKEQLDNKKM